MKVNTYKHVAVFAMTEFGLSDASKPTYKQAQAVEKYFVASKARSNAERVMAALRMSVKCVKQMNPLQFNKVLAWLIKKASQDAQKRPKFQR